MQRACFFVVCEKHTPLCTPLNLYIPLPQRVRDGPGGGGAGAAGGGCGRARAPGHQVRPGLRGRLPRTPRPRQAPVVTLPAGRPGYTIYIIQLCCMIHYIYPCDLVISVSFLNNFDLNVFLFVYTFESNSETQFFLI